jgi:WD40 repeat protein
VEEGRTEGTGGKNEKIEISHLTTTFTGHSGGVHSCAYSPHGARIVSGSNDNTLKIWDAKTGREQATFICDASVQAVAINSSGSKIAAGDYSGNVYFLKLEGSDTGTPIVTGTRLWHSRGADSSDAYAPDITTVCPFCGIQFPIAASLRAKGFRELIQSFRGNKLPSAPTLLDTILSINRDCHIGPDDSPCVKLPKEAWDDPHLLSECPKCQKPLRFNPFVVDNSLGQHSRK